MVWNNNPWKFSGLEFDQRQAGGGKKGARIGYALTLFALGCIGVMEYYAIYKPATERHKWKQIQEKNRRGIDQTKIQPGDMQVWSDPFKPKPKVE